MTGRWWLLAGAGVWIAVFSKESFWCMAVLSALVAADRFARRGGRRVDIVAGAICVLSPVILGAILGPPLMRGDGDVYGRPVGSDRVADALARLLGPELRGWVLALALAALAVGLWSKTRSDERETTVPALVKSLVLCLGLWVVFDSFLNAGDYRFPRYRAVTDLVSLILTAGAICVGIGVLRRPHHTGKRLVVTGLAITVLASISLGWSTVTNLQRTADAARFNGVVTREFERGLDSVMRTRTDGPVAVVVQYSFDHEPARAMLTELSRRSGDTYDLYLIVTDGPEPPLALDQLREVSLHGDEEWPTRPLVEVAASARALCVFLNVTPHVIDGCSTTDFVEVTIPGM
jgi:hypothetical protein